jgi:glycosyltransferase involved in cell wall biosynthesis
MLGRDALQFSKAAKIAFSFLWQQNVLRSATCFHATADSEVDDIREFGMRQPVAVIPNGIHLPKLESLVPAQQHYPGGQTVPFILSLGRIHPKKALDRLISAFALVAPTATNWRLRIVGQDERGYASQLQGLVRQHALCGKVTIEPPVYGEEKYRLMREAAVFVLPSLHENFANVVAESLSVETPVISSKGAPWSGLVSNKCGWWVEHGSAAIAEALSEAMRMPAEVRREMGVRGRAWIGRDFGWDGIQSKFLELHRWVSGQGDIPQFIRFK